MCQQGANRNPWTGYRTGLSQTPVSAITPKMGAENYPFQIAVKRLEIDENVNGARLIRYFLTMNLALNNRRPLQHLQKPRMSKRRSKTICAVIERHDHHCGGDLVSYTHVSNY